MIYEQDAVTTATGQATGQAEAGTSSPTASEDTASENAFFTVRGEGEAGTSHVSKRLRTREGPGSKVRDFQTA